MLQNFQVACLALSVRRRQPGVSHLPEHAADSQIRTAHPARPVYGFGGGIAITKAT